ncbi:MAG: hypothetical protein ACI8SJ_000149, partial [Shewanella sp.]
MKRFFISIALLLPCVLSSSSFAQSNFPLL